MSIKNHASTITEFLRNRRVTRDQLRAKQLQKFRRLVEYANQRSPYYQRLIKQLDIEPSTCVPGDFPILTKAEFIENFDDIVTDRSITSQRVSQFIDQSRNFGELLDGKYLVVHTSGTSGRVGHYIYTPEEWDRGHLHYLRINQLGIRRRVAHIAAMQGHFHGTVMVHRSQRGINRLFFDMRGFDINDPTHEIVAALNKFQPQMVSGYGGALRILSHFQASGELCIRPQRMYYGGEPLSGDERRRIGEIFGAPVISVYASSEHLIMGSTVPGTDEMRMFEDYLMYEFAEDHLRVTNLFNYSMPLIRYRMDDVLTPVGIQKKAHPFTLVKDLVGRVEKMLLFTNRFGEEDFIHPIVIAEFFVPNLQAFQVVLKGSTQFVFRAKIDPSLTPQQHDQTLHRIRAALEEILAQKKMENVNFDICVVDELSVDPKTRKFRLIVTEALQEKLEPSQ